MESRAGADMQQNDEKSAEKLMDEHLRLNGLYRKKIAKDGSCLFRAVAEQVLHCQGLHTRVRAECVKYLRQKRDLYESFIEGDFEEYLHMLQDPQSWVGQVEISALSVLYKHDFMIYQQPGEPPVNITENGYDDKVLLCFLNGNHYDSVYPISSIKTTAMCQSILYELLYERVYGVDRNVLLPSMRGTKGKTDTIEADVRDSSGASDLDEGEDFWSSEATGRTAGVNNRTVYKGRGRGQARGVGRGCLLPKVQDSLSPTLYRNVEYEQWLRSKRVQQRRDFCMAAGMHYKAGDKCQVRLNNTDRFYSAYIQDVSPDDGPVNVFIEELGEKHSVPLWNLRTSSEDSWSTMTEKSKRQTSSSSNGPTERDTKPGRKPMRSLSHGLTPPSGSAPGSRIQQQLSWPPQTNAEPQSLGKNGASRRSDQGAGGLCASPIEKNEQALLELLSKDEENFPTLEASAQAASVEGSRRAEKKGSKKKAGTDTKEQSLNPPPKADRGQQAKKGSVEQDQRISPPPKEDLNSTPPTMSPAPAAPKPTKAAPTSRTAPARVPYKTSSSLSARIPPVHSQTASAPSTRPTHSVQTTIQSSTTPAPSARPPDSVQSPLTETQTASAPSARPPDSVQTPLTESQTAPAPFARPPDSVQSPFTESQTAPAPFARPPDSVQTTPTESQTAPAPSARPPDSVQTTPIKTPTAPAPSTRPVLVFQAALETSEEIPSKASTPVRPQTPPMPATSVPTAVYSECTPAQCQTNSLPQNSSQTVQSQFLDPAAPVPINPASEATITHIPPQTTTVHLSPATPALNPVSTPLSSLSSSQTAPAPSQITSAAEVPGSTDLSAASKSPSAQMGSDSAGLPVPVHVPHSINSPVQPSPSLAPSYPVGLGTHLPHPPYPPYQPPVPSLSPNISGPMPDPRLPPAIPTPPFSHAAESYLYEPAGSPVAAGAGGALMPDPPPQPSVTLEQLFQDLLYPGFPQNDKGEPVQLPPFSHDHTGKDLPRDTSVLRFFFNLGLKAYMYQMYHPFTYLAPLYQAYQHIQSQIKVPPPISWQPDANSRPIFPPPNPSPAGSTPVGHFEVRGMIRTPSPMEVGVFTHQSLPLPMALPIASHPTVYASMPSGSPAPPPTLGPQHLSVRTPQHYAMEIPMPTVPPVMEGGQGAQRALTPQVDKTFWAVQGQQHLEGGDIKPGAVPVTIQHSSGAQTVLSGSALSKGVEPTMFANGNRREKSGGFARSSVEEWEKEKVEFGDVDLKTGRSYHSRAYKPGGRYGQDDRGPYRGRGSHGRREYTGRGRPDGQLPYHRGSGGRTRGRSYINTTRVSGYQGGQYAPAPES